MSHPPKIAAVACRRWFQVNLQSLFLLQAFVAITVAWGFIASEPVFRERYPAIVAQSLWVIPVFGTVAFTLLPLIQSAPTRYRVLARIARSVAAGAAFGLLGFAPLVGDAMREATAESQSPFEPLLLIPVIAMMGSVVGAALAGVTGITYDYFPRTALKA